MRFICLLASLVMFLPIYALQSNAKANVNFPKLPPYLKHTIDSKKQFKAPYAIKKSIQRISIPKSIRQKLKSNTNWQLSLTTSKLPNKQDRLYFRLEEDTPWIELTPNTPTLLDEGTPLTKEYSTPISLAYVSKDLDKKLSHSPIELTVTISTQAPLGKELPHE